MNSDVHLRLHLLQRQPKWDTIYAAGKKIPGEAQLNLVTATLT